jgi:hypothetical protein
VGVKQIHRRTAPTPWPTAKPLSCAPDIASLVRGIESGMKRESENVYRVDVVPMAEQKF